MRPITRRSRAGVIAFLLILSGTAIAAGCADGNTGRRNDAGDAGRSDAGARDAEAGSGDADVPPRDGDVGHPDGSTSGDVDAGGSDAGAPLPRPCNPELEYFEDEFGRQTYCVFVAPSGDDDAGEGSVTSPYRTIQRGIQVAVARSAATGRVHAVAVSRGTYDERVVLASGISVYGQFDAEDRWSRAEGNATIVRSRDVVDGRIEAVVAEDIDAPTVFEGFVVEAGPAPATSRNVDVYGVRVTGSSPVLPEYGGLVLRNLTVDANNGAAGEDGAPGEAGEPGVEGAPGDNGDKEDGDRTPGGAGAVSICRSVTVERTRGGDGGEGGGDAAMGCGTYREDARPGEAPPALPSCAGGTDGDACSCGEFDFDGEPGGPGNTCATEPATHGRAAAAPAVRGEVTFGVWVARAGDRGGDGAHGVGGSGGGGGGGGCDAVGWGPTGGGGGGGGSGGCGGSGGEGGRSGGSSFALFASDSIFAVSGSRFQSRVGGRGGAGGAGGSGGEGGPGGAGGTGGYAGGRGGSGQNGGAGGPGAGGPGGSSVAALLCGSRADGLELSALESGSAGQGGVAAEGGVAGIDGIAARLVEDCAF